MVPRKADADFRKRIMHRENDGPGIDRGGNARRDFQNNKNKHGATARG
jgi:hypothetical protein